MTPWFDKLSFCDGFGTFNFVVAIQKEKKKKKSKELCSKMALGEVGVWLPWWCHALVLPAPG